jgi:hypothetical protein
MAHKNPKYPDGMKKVAATLRAEGYKVVRKGKRFFVAEYAQSRTSMGS